MGTVFWVQFQGCGFWGCQEAKNGSPNNPTPNNRTCNYVKTLDRFTGPITNGLFIKTFNKTLVSTDILQITGNTPHVNITYKI